MSLLPGRLGSLVAADVMSRDVAVLRASSPLEEAVDLLRSRHVSGAPVVDDADRLCGLLSVADLLEATRDAPAAAPHVRTALPILQGHDRTTWELFERARPLAPEILVRRVGDVMTRAVAAVTEDAPLVEIARTMCDHHWHRVAVVDADGRLVGLVSTMDLLAALVNVADETVAE